MNLRHQDTISVLPTVELCLMKLGQFSPYVHMSFGEDTAFRINPGNTFAWRLGWGTAYRLNERVALNAE